MCVLSVVGIQGAHAAYQNGHLRRSQGEQLRLIDQQLLGRYGVSLLLIVAEAVGDRLEHREGLYIGLLLCGIHTARRKGHTYLDTCLFSRLFDSRATGQYDQIGQRHRLGEGILNRFQFREHLGQLIRLIGFPMVLGRQADTATVGAAPHVGATEGGGRGPSRRDHLRDGETGVEDLLLERSYILLCDQFMIDCRYRILPDQLLLRDFRPKVTGSRSHVAMGQLEPGAGEGVGELVRILPIASGDGLIVRVHAHGHISGGHDDRHLPGGILGRRCLIIVPRLLGGPLIGPGRALGQLPLVVEQHLEIAVVPLGRRRRPGAFQAAADLVAADAAAVAALPAETLLFDGGRFGLRPDQCRITGAVALTEGMTAGGERHRLLVVHGHAGEGLAHIPTRSDRIGFTVGAFRIDVNQAHLHRGQRVLKQIVIAGIALVIEPALFMPPVDILLRFPDVFTSTAETEGLETHGLQGHVAGQYQQVGPGDTAAVLLLDGPEQPSRLVQIDVVGPAVDGCETLIAGAGATTSVTGTVGARAVPGHADEHGAIVAVVRRPPLLGIGHQVGEIPFQRLVVELAERLGVVERLAHGIRL